ncbi:MAG: ATP-binding protein [Magnetovibrionaceae bacterium]
MQGFLRSIFFIFGFWILFQLAGLFDVAPNVSAFYPAPGLSIAFIAAFGLRYAPVVFIAAMLGSFPYHGFWDYAPQEWWQCVRQAVVYSAAGYSLRQLLPLERDVLGSRDVFNLLAVAILAPLISAGTAVLIFDLHDFFPDHLLIEVFFSFWAGDASGVIMSLPLLYGLLRLLRENSLADSLEVLRAKSLAFYSKAIVLPMFVAGLGFGAALIGEAGSNFGYLIVLPVVWLASTEGVIGGALSAVSANVSAATVFNLIGSQAYPSLELQVLFAVTGSVGLVVGAAFDERRIAEEERLKKEKEVSHLSRVATIGELGATISHEISSPLQSAMINAELAMEEFEKGNPESLGKIHSYNTQLKSAIETAAQIHKRILRYLRGEEREPTPASLAEAIKAAVDLVKADVKRGGIRLDIALGDSEARVLANPIEIQQVFINLIKNAHQALSSADSKEKRIALGLRSRPDGFVEVSVEDTGHGFPNEKAEEIFTSFYSTKSEGLGLGLSICRSIIQGYGGSIIAENWEQGARFIVRLPILECHQDA